MMSYSGKRSGRSRSSIDSALKRRASASARSSVRFRHCHAARPLRGEVVAASSIISPAPISSTFCSVRARKYPAGELHCGGSHRDDVGADAGIAAHFLRHRKRALEKLVEKRPEGTGRSANANAFSLAEDLRLATTMESSREATRNACRTASPCGKV